LTARKIKDSRKGRRN